jgi:hypothetical protein
MVLWMQLIWLGLWWWQPAPPIPVSTTGVATAEVVFGQGITFHLTTESSVADGLETDIPVMLRITHSQDPVGYVVPVQMTPTADGRMQASYPLSPALLSLPPFAELTYWWELPARDGTMTATLPQTVIYQDDRFAWQQTEADGVTVYWTGNDLGLDTAVWQLTSGTQEKLAAILPQAATRPVTVVLYPSSADLRAALRLNGLDWQDRGLPQHVPPQVDAVLATAVNSRTAVQDLQRTIPHAVTHLLVERAAQANGRTAPLWWVEGLALWAEGAEAADLWAALGSQTPIPLAQLCRDEAVFAAQRPLAAAQALAVVQTILAQDGQAGLARLSAALLDGVDCETAVQTSLQRSLAQVDAAWQAEVLPQSPMQLFWQANWVWLLLIVGGFVLVGLLVLRPQRP